VPASAAWCRNPPGIEGGGDRADPLSAFRLDSPKHGQQTAGMLVKRRRTATITGIDKVCRIAEPAAGSLPDGESGLVRSDISRRSFSDSAA
jgi:hypothetical protein